MFFVILCRIRGMVYWMGIMPLLYQLGALTVVVGWGKYVVNFINLVSGYNATNSIIQAPVAWDENTSSFFVTHAAINLPAIAITLAITVLLVVGIRPTAMGESRVGCDKNNCSINIHFCNL